MAIRGDMQFVVLLLVMTLPIAVAFGVLVFFIRRGAGLAADGAERCAECRYNLTGNVSGVCPECGTAFGARPVDSAHQT